MRIFYASESTPNAVFSSSLWRNNLYLPLVDLGHDVVEFQYDRFRETFANLDPSIPKQREFIRSNRPRMSAELLRQLKRAHAEKPIDLFFSYFYDACVLPETIEEIKRMGITTVNWYCNGAHQLHLVQEISPRYDWCLVPEEFRMEDYRALGARPIYCQEAANPTIYHPYDVPYQYDVTFVGQAYGERPYYVKRLLDAGIDARVWGWGWPKFLANPPKPAPPSLGKRMKKIGRKILTGDAFAAVGRRLSRVVGAAPATAGNAGGAAVPGGAPVGSQERIIIPDNVVGGVLSDVEMIQMYSRSKINLGFSGVSTTGTRGERILQIRLRDFEVPMSGGFYMVEYMEELEEFFEVGKEIVCYRDADDLIEKIRYYLAHDEEREAIRRAGLERCLREHTWHKRFESSFEQMGLS